MNNPHLFAELIARGLVKQITNPEKISTLLNGKDPITFYIGFDPTANSLHIGHLLQLITAKRLIDQGHKFIALIGGATARVGDVSGKNEMRPVLSVQEIETNGQKIQHQIETIVGSVSMANNLSWFDGLSFLTFMNDTARHFSVNHMLRAECFKSRLESNSGLSFLEFNYMLMQGFDFLHLFETDPDNQCILQLGGDDQWSNILAGIDLVHKRKAQEVFGLTLPLLTNSSGEKMGKTEKGAVWLNEDKTSSFDFFQFWRNLPDNDVEKCFKQLTFLSLEDIKKIMDGNINEAKKQLAFEITKIVRGEEKAKDVLDKSIAIFEKKDNTTAIKHIEISNLTPLKEAVFQCQWNECQSKTKSCNLIKGGGVEIFNGKKERERNPDHILDRKILGDRFILVKGGKERVMVSFR